MDITLSLLAFALSILGIIGCIVPALPGVVLSYAGLLCAYFGEKDFQQIAVIKAMVAQLRLPVEIVECPIVRGDDGLALSSRNQLLDAPYRAAAPHIYAVLRRAAEKSHELTPAGLKAWVTAEVESDPRLKVIYYQSVDALTMQEVPAWDASERIQGCIAVQAGDIRLIDNIRIR